MKSAIQHVLQTHPEIRAASYGRIARDWEVVQARANYFPTLDGSATWGYQKQVRPDVSDDVTRPQQQTIGLRQNVFRGGADMAEVNRQKSRVQSQTYIVQGTADNLALLTARVYLNVLRNMQLHELAKENLLNHERIADQVNLRMESGLDTRAEMDQVTGRMALARSNIVATLANLNDAMTDFQAVVGISPVDLDLVAPLDISFPTSLLEAEVSALENHPIIKSAMADMEARENQHKVAQRLQYPRFDLSADYNWNKDVFPIDGRRDYWAVAGTVSMNFFSGGRDYGRTQETKVLIQEANEILANAQRETTQSVRLSWEANQAARERVAYLREYAVAAQSTAEAFSTQWNIGRRTMFDLLDTQAESINSKSDLVRAQYELLYTEYRILNSLGQLVPSLGLEWPKEGRASEDG
ncbi:TolC family outer membrane protein [Desulfonatronum thiosulfatophilum]|nr:TolC family outer membrane protein [Desulfonatronum thiosulfatophilum]